MRAEEGRDLAQESEAITIGKGKEGKERWESKDCKNRRKRQGRKGKER